MNKLNALLVAIVATASMAFAGDPSTATVSGSTNQQNSAVVNTPQSNTTIGFTGAGGEQASSASFSGNSVPTPLNCWNWSPASTNGTATVSGSTEVGASTVYTATSINSQASGDTQNTASLAIYSNNGFTACLSGSGKMSTQTAAAIGNDSNGANGFTSTNGSFNYAANGGLGNILSGAGSTCGNGQTVVNTTPNGFSANSTSAVSVSSKVGL